MMEAQAQIETLGSGTPHPTPARLRPVHSFINLMNHKASQVLKKNNHSSLRHAFWSRSHSGQGRGGWEKGRAALAQ